MLYELFKYLKMKKLLILFCCLFASMNTIEAQSRISFQDVIFLKNGNILKGIIIEQKPNESLKIETNGGSIFYLKIDEISKIEKQAIESSQKIKKRKAKKSVFSSTEASILFGLNEDYPTAFQITTITGGIIGEKENVELGLGIGFEPNSGYRHPNNGRENLLKFFVDNRWNLELEGSNFLPFIKLNGGLYYSTEDFDFGSSGEYGFLGLGSGLRFYFRDYQAINFSFNYEARFGDDTELHMLLLNIGMTF